LADDARSPFENVTFGSQRLNLVPQAFQLGFHLYQPATFAVRWVDGVGFSTESGQV
jgi:hypothetical protein